MQEARCYTQLLTPAGTAVYMYCCPAMLWCMLPHTHTRTHRHPGRSPRDMCPVLSGPACHTVSVMWCVSHSLHSHFSLSCHRLGCKPSSMQRHAAVGEEGREAILGCGGSRGGRCRALGITGTQVHRYTALPSQCVLTVPLTHAPNHHLINNDSFCKDQKVGWQIMV